MAPYAFLDRPSPFNASYGTTLPVFALTPADIARGSVDPRALDWAQKTGFRAEAGSLMVIPSADGSMGGALFGLGPRPLDAPLATGTLARTLPAGEWHIEIAPMRAEDLAVGFALGAYRFEQFRKQEGPRPTLMIPTDADAAEIARKVAAVYLARDLVNMPTNMMGPDALEAAFRGLAEHYGATVTVVKGDALLENNFPMIHAVGRASAEAPRLLEMRWGRKGAPKVTLVGKGVCFDTGGLDIKPSAAMLLMKKDMGGAANVMALALMIMDRGLDIDLRVLVPAVENSISANAFRPGDILTSRKGLTVQIDNTDAEGRLILADALALADEDEPELIVDMATLTGAARVALGPDVPPFYTDDEILAGEIAVAAEAEADPLWRLPLYKGYERDVTAKIADLTNAPAGGFAGSITAALFLKRFVEKTPAWVHFDIYAWNPKDKPQGLTGGEAQAIRALYAVLARRYG